MKKINALKTIRVPCIIFSLILIGFNIQAQEITDQDTNFNKVAAEAIEDASEENESIHELERVVVTATGKLRMVDTPGSISIITSKELEDIGAKDIGEALNKIPGVTDTTSGNSNIAVRGVQSTMAGGPIILIDGVPQKIGISGYPQFQFIPISQIERIEVLRSAGIAYGPGSSRGLISIITKRGTKKKPFSIYASSSYGSWNSYDGNANIQGRLSQLDYFCDFGYSYTEGYEDEMRTRLGGLAKLGYNLTGNTRIGISSDIIDNEYQTAYGLGKYRWQLENYRREKHFPVSETDPTLLWHNSRDQDIASFALDFSHTGEKLSLKSSISRSNFDEKYNAMAKKNTSPDSAYIDEKDQITYVYTLSAGYHQKLGMLFYSPSIGLNIEDITFDSERSYPLDPDPGDKCDDYDIDIEQKIYGFFWDNDLLFGDHIGFKIGARIDRVELKYEDRSPNKFDTDETLLGWSAAPSYHFNDLSTLYVSIGKTFWFPSARYYAWAHQYDYEENRPEDMKPEESLTYELGYKHMIHKSVNISLTAFYTEYKDKFTSVYDDTSFRGMKNTGEAEYKGIELEADGRVLSWLGYRVAGSYLKAEWTKGRQKVNEHPTNDRIVSDLDGYDVYGVPNWTYLIGLDFYPIKGLMMGIDVNGSGPYYVDYLNRIEYDAKTTVDARISYRYGSLKVWALGKNILDEEVERVYNSTGALTEENGEPNNRYYVQDGRYLEFGVSYSL